MLSTDDPEMTARRIESSYMEDCKTLLRFKAEQDLSIEAFAEMKSFIDNSLKDADSWEKLNDCANRIKHMLASTTNADEAMDRERVKQTLRTDIDHAVTNIKNYTENLQLVIEEELKGEEENEGLRIEIERRKQSLKQAQEDLQKHEADHAAAASEKSSLLLRKEKFASNVDSMTLQKTILEQKRQRQAVKREQLKKPRVKKFN